MTGLNIAQIKDRAQAMGRTLSDSEAQNILSQSYDQSIYGADPSKVDALLGGASVSSPAQDVLNGLLKQIQDTQDKYNNRASEFDKNNPFTFDEAQAKASAQERYNPYYDAQLSDFMKGIDVQRSNAQGQRSLLQDLNNIQTAQDQTKLNSAIQASGEGYAGNGLFFSGARQQATGLANVAGNQQTAARQDAFNQNMLQNTNALSNINTQQSTGIRNTNAAQTTDIESEIARQKAEAEAQQATAKQAYVGLPYQGASSGFVNTLLGAFQ